MMLSLPPLSPNMWGLSPAAAMVDLRLLEIMIASPLSTLWSSSSHFTLPCLPAQYLMMLTIQLLLKSKTDASCTTNYSIQSSIVEDLPGKWIKSLRYLPI